ncbi:hypothetical protein N0V93_004963 [Gnomoniopsis smithogilvyi]|uniref:Mediator complex subunit 15 KIX domain-containing protein n=1 Tax=Gnomoniopsis smithogilvyi TaxID=1191159 RepID=A0A9W8YS06_9PEZI|nr:hypothetical protein N0V93_004963 [Gnomoniopsis smithogilvyi]
MAANMQQMAAAGQFMPQQQNRMGMGGDPRMGGGNIGHYIFSSISSTQMSMPPGWQSTVPIAERVRNVQMLVTYMALASGETNTNNQKIVDHVLALELDIFRSAPEKTAYDRRIQEKQQDLLQRRHNQTPRLQETMNMQQAQARQQMMMNAQQHQNAAMMRAQMAGRGVGPGQQGFQHLQNPMQISQLPQQAPQMGLSLSNGMTPQMNHAQPGFSMAGGPQQPPHQMQMSEMDKRRVQQEAVAMFSAMPPEQRRVMTENLARNMNPQLVQQAEASNKPILLQALMRQAQNKLFPQHARQQQMQQRQQSGMPTNPQGMSMPPGQQRPMNPNMMSNMGQPGGGMPFGNMETILNEQKQGMMAERQGQVVVPASSGPGHNATSQAPIGNMQHQNMFSQGPGQPPRPQGQNAFDMQQQQAMLKRQAQMHQARQANLQGQPGGLGGPMPGSQAPGMNTLNAPGPPPVAMGQMPGAQGPPGNPGFGSGLDPRFNQPGGQPGSTPGAQLEGLLAAMPPEQRQRFQNLPPNQLNSILQKFAADQQARQLQAGLPMNPANNTNPMGMPMQQANANLPPEVRAMMQQQQIQNRQRQAQASALQNPQLVQIMDNMDVPPQVFAALPGVPQEAKKWGQLKAWLQQANGVPEPIKAKLKSFQMQQFMNARQAMAAGRGAAANPQQPGPARQQPQQQQQQQQQPPPPPAELASIVVTPQEVQQVRANHPQMREAPEAQIRTLIQRMKWAQQRNGIQGGPRPQMGQGPPQTIAPPTSQPGVPQTAPQGFSQAQSSPAGASVAEPQSMARAASQANKINRAPQQQKPMPPNPSPAAAPKNLKRPNSDDLGTPSQATTGAAKPSQASQPQMEPPNLSEAQLASMTPEQRQAWERKKQMNKQMQECTMRFKSLWFEETRNFDPSKYPEVPCPDNARETLKSQLLNIAQGLGRVAQLAVMIRWFAAIRDEGRVREFLQTRLRVINQFQDGEKMQVLKENFTVSLQDVGRFALIVQGLYRDLASKSGAKPADGQSGRQQNQPNQPTSTATQAPQANEANSAKQNQAGTQVHNKLPQRPNSRGVQPPAAPTSTQPPFQFGANSPDGKPVYAATPQLTQEHLTLPRKKIKTGVQTSSPAGGSQNASPQTKAISPDLRKQQEPKAAPAKPTFPCTVADCEMGAPTFASEALRKKHIDEFHVQPFQNPMQFLEQAINEAYENVNQVKPDASVPQQPTAAGGAAVQSRKPDDKAASKASDNSTPVAEPQQPAMTEDFSMLNGTIDPQSLFAPAFSFDAMAGGVISNTNLYRSATPTEDTPESSKDSGTSEPNSDIPEAGSLDIDINFMPIEDGLFMDSLNLEYPTDGAFMGAVSDNLLSDLVASKSYEIQSLDMSLYSMDC